jgi:hypothetical protein
MKGAGAAGVADAVKEFHAVTRSLEAESSDISPDAER